MSPKPPPPPDPPETPITAIKVTHYADSRRTKRLWSVEILADPAVAADLVGWLSQVKFGSKPGGSGASGSA